MSSLLFDVRPTRSSQHKSQFKHQRSKKTNELNSKFPPENGVFFIKDNKILTKQNLSTSFIFFS